MAADNAPITMKEVITLPGIGIDPQFITFPCVTMESDKYICVTETSPHNSVVIIDMCVPNHPLRRPIAADSALMNPDSRILALKAQLPGTTEDHVQIFNIAMKAKVKSHQMPVQIVFWKWISPKKLGLVTRTSVYHWSIEGDSEPAKMFERTDKLAFNQIINYRCDPNEKWLVLIGLAPGSPERPQLLKGNMQLFSVDQQRSQVLEAHAASFASFKVSGNDKDSVFISFATKTANDGQITAKLHVIELGAQPGKPPSFTKQAADLLFPPDFDDDFPVAMQISQKYGLIYVITKLGLLFLYDLETATAVYRIRISSDPIFLTADAPSVGGFYAVNRRGQVLLVTVNEATIVPYISRQLNNLELAVNLAKRGNLPGAEHLAVQRFPELFAHTKHKEAAEFAAESPQGFLRTPDTVAKFHVEARLRDTTTTMEQQMEAATLKANERAEKYFKEETSELIQQIIKSYEEQITQRLESVERRVLDTTTRLEQLAEADATQMKVNEIAQQQVTQRFYEEVESRVKEVKTRLEQQLAQAEAARLKADKRAQEAQKNSDKNIQKLLETHETTMNAEEISELIHQLNKSNQEQTTQRIDTVEARLRDTTTTMEQQMEAATLKANERAEKYLTEETSELIQRISKTYEEKMTQRLEAVEQRVLDTATRLDQLAEAHAAQMKVVSSVKDVTTRLEQQLAEAEAARLKADERAQAAQKNSDEQIQKLKELFERGESRRSETVLEFESSSFHVYDPSTYLLQSTIK